MKECRFIENVKGVCNHRGMSYKSLCDKAGMTSSGFLKYKHGALPNLYTVINIADVLGISLDDLVFGNLEDIVNKSGAAVNKNRAVKWV